MKNSKMAALLAVLVLAVAMVNAAETTTVTATAPATVTFTATAPATVPATATATVAVQTERQRAGIGLSFGVVPYLGLRDSRIVGIGLTTDIVFCLDKNLDLKIFMEDISLDAEDDNNLQSDGNASVSGLGIGYTVWSGYGKVSVGIGMGRLAVNLPATGAGTDLAQTVPCVSIDLGVGNVWKGDKIDVEMGVELKIRWAELEDVDVFGTGDPSDFVTDFHQVPQIAIKLGILF